MKTAAKLFVFLLISFVFIVAAGNDGDSNLEKAREISQKFMSELKTALKKNMKEGGPSRAIKVCSELAPEISSRFSRKTGWRIGRTSLKVRNPKNMPDKWELEKLYKLEKLNGKSSEKPPEVYDIVKKKDRKYFRYMKAIPTKEICLNCHGSKKSMSKEIKNILAEKYPSDKATGYKTGEIRGAFTFKKPL